MEDDLEFSPDFLEYFEATLTLLRSDPSLWCVSAWNDNGKRGLIDETKPELLYRTDFFGGLGWMITKELWANVSRPLNYNKFFLLIFSLFILKSPMRSWPRIPYTKELWANVSRPLTK